MFSSETGAHIASWADCARITTSPSRGAKTSPQGPPFAVDCYFMRMQHAVNAQTRSEETIKFITVKEDEHQNIMCSVALKRESKSRA